MVSEAAVLQALRAIRDPEAQQDIVALGLVRDVRITEADVSFTLAFTAQSPQAKATIHSMASRLVGQLPGVSRVQVHGIKMMSIGLLVNEREPLVWRGPMIHSFIQQMLRDVMWGALDYLVFDMPPGTGDAQLSLSQVIPLDGVVMVTTPQEVALLDVRKAIGMFQKLNVPVLGVVENMSYFVAPDTGRRYDIFGEGGGRRLADEYGIPLLAQLPLDLETRVGGDEGSPITVRRPDSSQAKAFRDLALAVRTRLDELAALKPLPKIT